MWVLLLLAKLNTVIDGITTVNIVDLDGKVTVVYGVLDVVLILDLV